jgi:hypothetical protein
MPKPQNRLSVDRLGQLIYEIRAPTCYARFRPRANLQRGNRSVELSGETEPEPFSEGLRFSAFRQGMEKLEMPKWHFKFGAGTRAFKVTICDLKIAWRATVFAEGLYRAWRQMS